MCPVCRARFRGAAECSRCGADLRTLMVLLARSWRLRQAAREAILEGDPGRARALASQAQQLAASEPGKRLEALSSWLMSHDVEPHISPRNAKVRRVISDQLELEFMSEPLAHELLAH